ncbi:MAG: hypothetical protein KAY24_12805 [Candidatus Eisenbacteria sp.]|nr:hypothetical protein [Candidatus Eisenbacteria bacterium]
MIASAIAALLATAMVNVFSNAFDLSQMVRQGEGIRRDAQLSVSLLHRDISCAKRLLAVSPTCLDLLSADGDLIRYKWSGASSDSLCRQVNGGALRAVAADVDTLCFNLYTVSRSYTSEKCLPDTLEKIVVKFEEGDWDAWVASTDCEYRDRGQRRVQDDDWCAEEFWEPPEDFAAFSRTALRVIAKDHLPAQVDLLVEVYEADTSPDAYPGTLLAEGRIDRNSLTALYEWYEVSLTTVDSTPIAAGGHYWLVLRPDGSGGNSYAGHIQRERIKDCDPGEWPQNGMCYRESDNEGTSWKAQRIDEEVFYRLHGFQVTPKLTEVTETVADTIGVSYLLTLKRNGEMERRAGFVALHNL